MRRIGKGFTAALAAAVLAGSIPASPALVEAASNVVQQQQQATGRTSTPAVSMARAAAVIAMLGAGAPLMGYRHEPVWTGRLRSPGWRARKGSTGRHG